jgi:tripartite-type tricarboxylate transporter receptor subunit TctC
MMAAASVARFLLNGAGRIAGRAAVAGSALALCAMQHAAASAVYPVKPIRIITASSPGAAEDFFARSIGAELAAFYQKSVVIENRSGAGGLIGNERVSKASADGYTLGMVSVSRIIRELMHERPPYRSLADIAGVAHVASITNVLAVANTLPVRTAAQFVAYARPRFGELNYASLGIGSASHLAGEVFTRAVGIEAIHVPFRNLSDSYIEMMLGRVHYAVQTLPAVLGPVRDGRMRALAVMTPQRSPALPNVPAIAEFGLPEAQFDSWSGIVVPAGTPRRIVEQLHGDIVRALRKPALRESFVSQGAESMPESTPDAFMRLMQVEYLRYRTLLNRTRITASGDYACASGAPPGAAPAQC